MPDLIEILQKRAVSPEDVFVHTPVTVPELGSTTLQYVGIPHVLSNLLGSGSTLAQSVGFGFGPSSSVYMSAYDAIESATGAAKDPDYAAGRISYPEALQQQMQMRARKVGQAAMEAKERYGAAGVPVQALQGVINPLSSIGYAVGQLKDTLLGGKGAALCRRAEKTVQDALMEAEHAL
jgi:hypothetical protein